MPTTVNIVPVAFGIRTYASKDREIEKGAGVPTKGQPDGIDPSQLGLWHFKKLADFLVKAINKGVQDARTAHANAFGGGKKTLIVFMAPEFFFQIHLNGVKPYPESAMTEGLAYLASKCPANADVLIFPGTIWWWQPDPAKPNDPSAKIVVRNTAPVIHKQKVIKHWHKQNYADIDGFKEKEHIWSPQTFQPGGNLTVTPTFDLPLTGDVTLKVGLEICADHGHRYLLRDHMKNKKTLDLQVLLAAGKPLDADALALKTGGVFLCCDGYTATYRLSYRRITADFNRPAPRVESANNVPAPGTRSWGTCAGVDFQGGKMFCPGPLELTK